MSKVFRSAIEMDEYLSSLTPAEREQLGPTAYKDQVRAAQKEGIAEREARLGKKAHWVPHAGLPDWVRLGMYDVMLKWSEGKALTCIHQPRMSRPEPVYTAAWKPGCLVCAQCTDMLKVTGVADTICDGCGHECQGLPDDGIMSISAFCGSMAYQFGVCVDCHKDMLRVEEEAVQQLNNPPREKE